ncbi:MAG: type II toxin-antitoxin system RelE/ParE family toxin [Roseiflexaceae bacterium]
MNEYAITFARSARKELEALDTATIRRIFPKIEALANDPRPRGCLKLQGEDHLWRIRVGYYRIIYAIDAEKQIIDIIAVRHRRDAYR